MRGRPKAVREGRPRFVWTRERRVELCRLYLELDLGPTAIALRLGGGATREIVQHKITAMALTPFRTPEQQAQRRLDALERAAEGRRRARAARGQVVWTPAARDRLRRLYLVEDLPPALIAVDLVMPVLSVRREIKLSGLAKARRAMGKPRMRARRLADIPALVAIQRLPPGAARGLSAMETRFHAAPAPRTDRELAEGARGRATVARNRELRLTAEGVERRLLTAPGPRARIGGGA